VDKAKKWHGKNFVKNNKRKKCRNLSKSVKKKKKQQRYEKFEPC
jgi:hypothetical protein